MGFGRILIEKDEIGCVFGVSLLGKVKSGAFLTYPDGEMWNRAGFSCTRVGAQKHTPRNVLRRRFGCKTGCVLGVAVLGRVKTGAFLAYPGAEM